MQQRIFIIGLPGVGKSTLANKLANILGLPFVDLDNYIGETQEHTITQIFNEGGEKTFRNIEAHALRSFSQLNNSFVMACGGGTPCYNNNIEFMNQNGVTVYYQKPLTEIISQLKNDTVERPLLKNTTPEELPNYLNNLLTKREPYYLKSNVITDGIESALNSLNSLA